MPQHTEEDDVLATERWCNSQLSRCKTGIKRSEKRERSLTRGRFLHLLPLPLLLLSLKNIQRNT